MKLGRKLLWLFLLLLIGVSALGMILMTRSDEGGLNWKTHGEIEDTALNGTLTGKRSQTDPDKITGTVPRPEIDEQLLTKNKWSRCGKKTQGVKYLVIHYLGNPGTTAQANRDYFESLKDLKNESMSSNYIIGLDGEIIQCVPDDEIAYASNSANKESISIENCNIDKTGKFIKDTYISLVKLTAYLAEKYQLDKEHVIRHYDVTGKECPLFYVENEELWDLFLDDVFFYIDLCHQNNPAADRLEDMLDGIKYTYSSKFDGSIVADQDEEEETGRPHDVENASSDTPIDDFEDAHPEEPWYDEEAAEGSDDYYDDQSDSGYDEHYTPEQEEDYSDSSYSGDGSEENYSDGSDSYSDTSYDNSSYDSGSNEDNSDSGSYVEEAYDGGYDENLSVPDESNYDSTDSGYIDPSNEGGDASYLDEIELDGGVIVVE